MTTKTLLFPLVMVLGPLLCGADVVQVDFSKDAADRLFEGDSEKVPVVEEGLVALTASSDTRAFPVESGKKYKLEISAGVGGDFVVEKNDRAHILTLQSHQHRLSSGYAVVFEGADGGEIPGLGGDGVRGFFLTSAFRPYTSVFYAPPGAKNLKVRFQTNGRATRIAGLRLAEETEEGTVNPNPDFRYGELSYSGWRPGRDGRIFQRPDGKFVLNVGRGGVSPVFPLEAGRKYRAMARGTGDAVNIQYLDSGGKSLLSSFLFRPVPESVETEFVPPQETAAGRLVFGGGAILEDIRVTPEK